MAREQGCSTSGIHGVRVGGGDKFLSRKRADGQGGGPTAGGGGDKPGQADERPVERADKNVSSAERNVRDRHQNQNGMKGQPGEQGCQRGDQSKEENGKE